MIQRIQTVYLIIATLLASAYSFFSDFALVLWEKISLLEVSSSLLAIAVSLFSFTGIFLFKNRKLQISLISFTLVILFAAIIVYPIVQGFDDFYKDWSYFLLPVAFIVLILARKGVKADEELIRSANRLR